METATHETTDQSIAPHTNTTPMDGTMWWVKGYTPIIDPKELAEVFGRFLDQAEFIRVQRAEQLFIPVGYTRLDLMAQNHPTLHSGDLLAESHFAIHTFPPKRTYFELSSCVQAKWEAFLALLQADPQERFRDIKYDDFGPDDFPLPEAR